MPLPLTTANQHPPGERKQTNARPPLESRHPQPSLPAALRWARFGTLNGRASLRDRWSERPSAHRSPSLLLPVKAPPSLPSDPSWVFQLAAWSSEGRAEGWLQVRSSSLTCCCCDKWVPRCWFLFHYIPPEQIYVVIAHSFTSNSSVRYSDMTLLLADPPVTLFPCFFSK